MARQEGLRCQDRSERLSRPKSRTADIDFTFAAPVSIAALVDALAPAGWSPVEPLGISYLIEDDGGFDWQSTGPGDLDRISRTLEATENADFHIGISLYNKDAETGGTLLLYPGRTEASFTPSINRRELPDHAGMTDIPWYLQELIPTLSALSLTGYEARDMAD